MIDEQSKLDPLLPQTKRMVGDNGLVTIQEVFMHYDAPLIQSTGLVITG